MQSMVPPPDNNKNNNKNKKNNKKNNKKKNSSNVEPITTEYKEPVNSVTSYRSRLPLTKQVTQRFALKFLHHAGSRSDPPFDPTRIRPSLVSTYNSGTRRNAWLRAPKTSRSSMGITNERRIRPPDHLISGPSIADAKTLRKRLTRWFLSTPSIILGTFNDVILQDSTSRIKRLQSNAQCSFGNCSLPLDHRLTEQSSLLL